MANLNLNKVILGGRLTSAVELKQTPNGVMVCSFSIAVNRKQSKDKEQVADFINCVAWRERAEFISKYFTKGSSICIVGQIQTRTWTDNSGNKRYATEVVVDETFFVDSKSDNAGQQTTAQNNYMPSTYAEPTAAPQFEVIENDDELPF